MSGYGDTMDATTEPRLPVLTTVPSPAGNASAAELNETQTQQIAHQTTFDTAYTAYTRAITIWKEKQLRACMGIRSKCEYNNSQKISPFNRVYQVLEVLKAGRESGSGKLMELTTRFYALNLADCKSMSDFSGQLTQVNNELQDLYPSTAFSQIQLVLRFLQGLGSAYDIFITTLTQSINFIEAPGNPAVTFDSVTQRAYNEEQRQNSSFIGGGHA